MRSKGKITFWKGNKGYGFITPDSGEKQVFVHINAFADKNQRPRINQLVSFSLSTDKQGRPCAVNVTRPGEQTPKMIKGGNSSWSFKSIVLLVIVIIIAAAVAYSKYEKSRSGPAMRFKASNPASSVSKPPSNFRCDGRTHCSDMTSCEEAKFFIQNCPNTKMDGDGDGVPCESQWCG